jgi:hypothetical protein
MTTTGAPAGNGATAEAAAGEDELDEASEVVAVPAAWSFPLPHPVSKVSETARVMETNGSERRGNRMIMDF